MIDKNKNYVVIWVSENQEKYWYKVFKDLLENNYKVWWVNPKWGILLWAEIKESLEDIKEKIDIVIFVTPPIITETVLTRVKELNIQEVWFQPGAESEKSIQFCEKNNISYTANACIMIQKKTKRYFLT